MTGSGTVTAGMVQRVLARTVEIAGVAAPPLDEADRTALVERWWIADGLEAVSVDRVGNVWACIRPGEVAQLTPRAIINPGSVGQPRDRDPRSAYAIYDPQACTWQPCRVAYDIDAVQKRIRAAGLPEKHAVRLAEGW